MASYYADSSALAKRHVVDEAGCRWTRDTLELPESYVVTSRFSLVEIFSALNRRLREGGLRREVYPDVAQDVLNLFGSEYEMVDLSTAVLDRARLLVENHPLRAADAVQLASALFANEAFVAKEFPPLVFLAADDRLLAAAKAEGLAVDNPNAHP